jgi:hypothetical protein
VWRAASVAGCVTLALAACGDSEESTGRSMIDWNLAEPPTTASVDWPKPDQSVVSLEPVEEVRLRLPDGSTFEADHDLKRVFLEREDDSVTLVAVYSDSLGVDAGYRLASDWAERFELPTAPLERWRDEVTSGKEPAERNNRALTSATIDDRIGEDGPVPSVNILYSFDEEKPATVTVELFWPPERRS